MSDYGPKPELLSQLTAGDYPEEGSVTVTLQDGSVCRLRNAFYHREGDWIVVYSKTAGCFAFKLRRVASIRGVVRTEDDRFALL